jgi:hypothetical protein
MQGHMIDEDYEPISHWGLIDLSAQRQGTLTVFCDKDGQPHGYMHQSPDDASPMLVVSYQGVGILSLMGERRTGIITQRIWVPHHEGAMPPHDRFSGSLRPGEVLPSSTTRH